MTQHVAGQRREVASPHGYIAGIDGLRAIAVLAVVAYHIDENLLPGGFIGVDLFFVISGFVVSMATSSIQVQGFPNLLFAFYRRRIVRILPAALMFILTAQLAAALFLPVVDRLTTPDITGAAATAGMSNIVLWMKAGDYFSPAAVLNLFTHTWSLAVEEQFYLIFPFFAVATLLGQDRRSLKWGVVTLTGLSAASLACAAYTTQNHPSFAFYMLPSRFWELASGMLLFIAIGGSGQLDLGTKPSPRIIICLSLLGGGLLAGSLLLVTPQRFPFPLAIAPVLAGLALIYVVSISPQSWLARTLSLPLLRYFGRISYSLYLWHWGVIVVMLWTVGMHGTLQKVTAALLSFGLAHLSYRCVERPVRASRWIKNTKDWQVVALGVTAIGLSGASFVGLTLARPTISLSRTSDLDTWLGSSQTGEGRCEFAREKQGIPGGTRYDFVPSACTGLKDSRALYIVGDSHAWAYQRLAGNLAGSQGLGSTVYMATGCAVLPVNVLDATTSGCPAFISRSLDEVASVAKRGDIVFLPGLRVQRYREYWDAYLSPVRPTIQYTPAMIAAAAAPLSAILDKGVRIVIEAPKPVYTVAAFRCVDWYSAGNPHCQQLPPTRIAMELRRAPAMAMIAAVRRQDPRIELLDPLNTLCPGVVCTPMIGGKPVANDGDHASGWTNDRMTPVLSNLIGRDLSSEVGRDPER